MIEAIEDLVIVCAQCGDRDCECCECCGADAYELWRDQICEACWAEADEVTV